MTASQLVSEELSASGALPSIHSTDSTSFSVNQLTFWSVCLCREPVIQAPRASSEAHHSHSITKDPKMLHAVSSRSRHRPPPLSSRSDNHHLLGLAWLTAAALTS